MKRTWRRFAPALAALILALALCPASALAAEQDTGGSNQAPSAAYPAEVRESEENGVHRIEKVYVLSVRDDPAAIPTADFEREGRSYTLLDVIKNDQTETDAKDHIEVVTLATDTKDVAAIIQQLEPALEVTTEDGYTGTLTPDYPGITVEADGYQTSSRTVTATRSYPNLSDADASLIPKSITDSGRTLTLADIQWQEAGGYYNATATYSGTATSSYVTGYTVTAEYAGEVVKTLSGQMVYTAVFSGTPINPVTSDQPEENNSTETPPPGAAEDEPVPTPTSSGNGLYWLLLLPVGAGAAGLAFGGKFLLKKYKSKKEWKEYTT